MADQKDQKDKNGAPVSVPGAEVAVAGAEVAKDSSLVAEAGAEGAALGAEVTQAAEIGLDDAKGALIEGLAEGLDPEGADEAVAKQKKNWKSMLPLPSALVGGHESKSPDDRKRTWDLTFAVRSMTNVTTKQVLKVFFTVSINHEKIPKRGIPGLLPKFTPIYWLQKSEQHVLDIPLLLHDQRKVKLSYKDLARYNVQVDMWQVSTLTFNVYYGIVKKTFAQIITREASMSLILQQKLTKKDMADKHKRKNCPDVATFQCVIQFEEFFNFKMAADHWTLDMSKYDGAWKNKAGKPDPKLHKRKKEQRKRLYFQVPPNKNVLVDRAGYLSLAGRPQAYYAAWNRKTDTMFWDAGGEYNYRGTRTHLKQSYFIVSVYIGDPSESIVSMPNVQSSKPVGDSLLGKAMLAFTSILDLSVLKGSVKAVLGRDLEVVGDLTGNMKCKQLSLGMREDEVELGTALTKIYDAGQTIVSGSVSHLNKHEQHLVVRVKKCQNLPMSQPDAGSSDPYLRVRWDNMEQRCPKQEATLRPIYNFNFYFPVRSVIMDRLRKKRPETIDLWKQELNIKGNAWIEVWDDDIASSQFLGKCKISMNDILTSKMKEDRDMLGEIKKAKKGDDDDDDDEEPPPEVGKQWYQHALNTRIYDCKTQGLPLSGSELTASTGVPTCYFEAYFYDDVSRAVKDCNDSDDEDAAEEAGFWKRAMETFHRHNLAFQKDFVYAFPNAVGAKPCKNLAKDQPETFQVGQSLRIFHSLVRNPDGVLADRVALMSFLTAIIVPEALQHPIDKMHWIHCLSWSPSSMKYMREGILPLGCWKSPSFILQARRGAATCHALVLCSLLLGGKKDAYVCKGTVYATMPAVEGQAERLQLVEHCWVMTREEGWVTFWEPMNGKLYHLPKRYKPEQKIGADADGKKDKKKKKAEAEEEGEEDDDDIDKPPELLYEGEAPDAKVEAEDMDALPTVGRHPRAKAKLNKRKEELEDSAKKKEELLAMRELLIFAPNKKMLQDDTLVTSLPYESIDTIWNANNLWANHQNHHPALIMYDLPDKDEEYVTADPKHKKQNSPWCPFLTGNNFKEMISESIEINAIGDANVSLTKPLNSALVAQLKKDIVQELEENLRLYRSKLGFDCIMAKDEYVVRECENFLNIQEKMMGIDPDFIETAKANFKDPENYDYLKKLMREPACNKKGSVFMASGIYSSYRDQQKQRCEEVEAMIKDFREKKEDFPVRRGKEFKGMTVHFCTSDKEDMRSYLMELEEYKYYINIPHDDVVYTIQAIVTALAGGVQSVWVFVGMQEKPKPKAKDDEEGAE